MLQSADMMIRCLMLIILLVVCHTRAGEENICERNKQKRPLQYWMNRYNMIQIPFGFKTSMIHKSSEIFANSTDLAPWELAHGNVYRHRYLVVTWAVEDSMNLKFIRPNYKVLYHFLDGDSVILHTIHPQTGELKSTRLGFDGRFAVTYPGYWLAVEFQKQEKGQFAFLTVTTLGNRGTMELTRAENDKMIENFPQHSEVINRVS